MRSRLYLFGILLLQIICFSCENKEVPGIHELPEPEDTATRPIKQQEKCEYKIDGITVSNLFAGARVNGFEKINNSTYRVTISPENYPINASSYYAFDIVSDKKRNIKLEMFYIGYPHRYKPKLSYDKKNWTIMDSTRYDTLKAGNIATLRLNIGPDTLTIAAQELYPSQHAINWADSLSRTYPEVTIEIIGKSMLGRDIVFMDIGHEPKVDKNAVVVFSRLHPPEVTGYLAMMSFVETILDTTVLARVFRENFRIFVYPMMNPDGVDLGHWRHNAGGIDLNRDWSHYRQPESELIAHHLTKLVRQDNNEVLLGIDFHSTQEDLYYTLTDNRKSSIYNFKDLWLNAIDEEFEKYTPDDQPFDLNQPITKAWFYLEFGAEGITYEVGDETPREFVKAKARVAAEEMMKLLVLMD